MDRSNILIPLGKNVSQSNCVTLKTSLKTPRNTLPPIQTKSKLKSLSEVPKIDIEEETFLVTKPDKMTLPKSPRKSLPKLKVSARSQTQVVDDLMDISSTDLEESSRPEVEASFIAEDELVGSISANPIQTQTSQVYHSPSTAQFETYEGIVQDKDVEQSLIDSGFLPTEKILTKDENGLVSCQFIKARDKLGHSAFVEVDTDYTNGMGFIKVSDNDRVMSVSQEASVIPYSMKIGTFEANKDLYGVGFVCDNNICMMQRKDPSLAPTETVFSTSTDGLETSGIIQDHPIPYPIVKMSEILTNPAEVERSVSESHKRMRNVAFNHCQKDVDLLKSRLNMLDAEVDKFDKISNEVSNSLACTIETLEQYHEGYSAKPTLCNEDLDKLRRLRFNLQKRHDLLSDHIGLCKAVKERSDKIAALTREITELNQYASTLFAGINGELIE